MMEKSMQIGKIVGKFSSEGVKTMRVWRGNLDSMIF